MYVLRLSAPLLHCLLSNILQDVRFCPWEQDLILPILDFTQMEKFHPASTLRYIVLVYSWSEFQHEIKCLSL